MIVSQPTEQPVPIEQLLKETETALYLGGWDYKIPSSTVRRLIDELRQRLEREHPVLSKSVVKRLQAQKGPGFRGTVEGIVAPFTSIQSGTWGASIVDEVCCAVDDELRQRTEKEKQSDVGSKRVKACLTCTDPYCAECSEADHPDNYCSRVCEGRSETEDSVAEE